MKERIQQVIQYATHGNLQRFAHTLGWSRQYIGNILAGRRGIGIIPVQKVLRAYPDISARWLLTGEGTMLRSASQTLLDCLHEVVRLEQDTGRAKDITRTVRTMERLTARLKGENCTKTAP